MVVRLQTAEGRIKEYKTTQVKLVTWGDTCYIDKYFTKCGLEWKEEPKPHEECDHLGCAIYLAKRKRNAGPVGFMFSIVITALLMFLSLMEQSPIIILLIIPGFMFALLAFYSLISGLRAWKELLDLTEYSDKGTINGVKAWKIIDQDFSQALAISAAPKDRI